MAEKHIQFISSSLQAILEGRKTQFRMIVNPEPQMVTDKSIVPWAGDPAILMKALEQSGQRCPYGSGDRLWVRETYWVDEEDGKILYRANKDDFQIILHNKSETGSPRYNWRPSSIMPRWASRITLEIVSVRVERLQEITADDAMAEGIVRLPDGGYAADTEGRHYHAASAFYSYGSLWEATNGSGSWDANPWVWVISFTRNQAT